MGSALSRISPPYKKNARLDYVCAKCAGIFSPIATLAVISALGVGWAKARFRAVPTKKQERGDALSIHPPFEGCSIYLPSLLIRPSRNMHNLNCGIPRAIATCAKISSDRVMRRATNIFK